MQIKMRLLLIAILFFISNFANAQERGIGEFENKSIVLPPGPPEEPSKISGFFELKDYNNKELIRDIHVYVTILDIERNIETNTLKYINEIGILELRLDPGYYRLTFKVDD